MQNFCNQLYHDQYFLDKIHYINNNKIISLRYNIKLNLETFLNLYHLLMFIQNDYRILYIC